MSQPKPYSDTDADEQEAYATLLQLLDLRCFKLDIRTRDKYPNVDGTIELVTDAQVPYGKFDVQLRKIPVGANKYSCPSSLLEYSRVSILPVVLICVDTENGKAYWRQITPTMPEFKENQKSFTIRFDDFADAIDRRTTHVPGWTEMVKEYQERIERYPLLSREVDLKLVMPGLTKDLKKTFQRFIDTVNNLLDGEFVSFKTQLFPWAWKFGVAAAPYGVDRIFYQVREIPYGDPAPLVCQADASVLLRGQDAPRVLCQTHVGRERLQDPEAMARGFVLDHVKHGVERQVLSIHGAMLAADVVTCFVDQYYVLLGLPKGNDSYQLSDLQQALYRHMYGVCAALADRVRTGQGELVHLNLDSAVAMWQTNPVDPIRPSETVAFVLSSSRPPMRLFLDALHYLAAKRIASVERVFAQRASFGTGWIWRGYSPEDETRSVSKILAASVDEYSSFVSGNRLRLPNSPFLDDDIAILYEYHSSKYAQSPWSGPLVKSWYLENHDRRLAKVSVRVRTGAEEAIDDTTFPQVTIDGEPFQAKESSSSAADFLFHDMPVLHTVYRMLREDLQRHYEIGMITLPY
jgi:hypothetical protein